MTLTEFLLARIAEDEQMANEGVDAGRCTCRPNPRSLLRRIDVHHPQCALRVLAECEAKRRIVADCAEYEGPETDGLSWRTLHAIALVYADHPDYRDEWRP